MNNVNTNSLFHYTNNFENLIGIIRKGLLPNFCKEVLPDDETIGIPMVSFCDIPLTRADEHRGKYGKFAIGLNKLWGDKNGLNPVLYLKSNSLKGAINNLSMTFKQAEQYRNQEITKLKSDPSQTSVKSDGTLIITPKDQSFDTLCTLMGTSADCFTKEYLYGFIKIYEGTDRHGRPTINYNENEWRCILGENSEVNWLRGEEDYLKWRGKGDKPKSIFKPLTFEVNDIRYILMEKEAEIEKLIKSIKILKTIGGNKTVGYADKELLMTKIMSVERLSDDF